MQFLPLVFEKAETVMASTRSVVTKAYSGLQEAQSGNFSDFFKKETEDKFDLEAQQKIQNYYSQGTQKAQEIQNMLSLSAVQDIANNLMADFKNNAYDMNMNGEENSLSHHFVSPYSMHDISQSSSEVRFNESEVDELIAAMIAGGYTNQNALTALEEAGENLNGTTAEFLMQAATAGLIGEEQSLSKLQEQQLLNLSQKLMTGSSSGEEIFNSLMSKSPNDVLQSISDVLAEKGSVSFNQNDMNALSSLLNLSESEKSKLTNLFENAGNVELTQQDFDALMASAKQEIAQKQKDLVEFNNALAQNLESLEAKARERMDAELSAQNYEDKRTEISRKTMENTQLEDILEGFKNSDLDEEAYLNQIKFFEDVETIENIREPEVLSSSLENSLKNALSLSRDSSNTQEESHKENSSMLGQGTQNNTNVELGKNSKLSTESIAQRFDSTLNQQIEEALSKAMKGNMNKLEVELNPVELGALTITLSSKGGEMTAQIQSERLETMHVINQQLDVIKRELENQGIKLESIEVDLKSNDSNQFAEHRENGNNQQESLQQYETMNQQVNDLNRLRVLGRAINEGMIDKSALTEEEYELAQNLLEDSSEESNLLLDSLDENGLYINTRA